MPDVFGLNVFAVPCAMLTGISFLLCRFKLAFVVFRLLGLHHTQDAGDVF